LNSHIHKAKSVKEKIWSNLSENHRRLRGCCKNGAAAASLALFAPRTRRKYFAEREQFLDQSCGTDDGLRRAVEKLLAALEDTESIKRC